MAGQDVDPFGAVVGPRLGSTLLVGMTIFHACMPSGCSGQRDDGPALDLAGLEPDARVAHLGRADEVVERHPVGLRQREEQLQGRPALPGLEPRTACSWRCRWSPRRRSGSSRAGYGACLSRGADLVQRCRRSPLRGVVHGLISLPLPRNSNVRWRSGTRGPRWGHEQIRRSGHRRRRRRAVRRPGPVPRPARRGRGGRGCAAQRPGHPHARLPVPRRTATRASCWPSGATRSTSYGGEIVAGTVTDLVPDGRSGFWVLLADGQRISSTAPAGHHRPARRAPRHPRAPDRWARDVLHCPYCHGHEVRDRQLGVIGGTPGAVRYAQIVRQWTHDLVYFTPPDLLTATERTQLRRPRHRRRRGHHRTARHRRRPAARRPDGRRLRRAPRRAVRPTPLRPEQPPARRPRLRRRRRRLGHHGRHRAHQRPRRVGRRQRRRPARPGHHRRRRRLRGRHRPQRRPRRRRRPQRRPRLRPRPPAQP